MTVLTSPLSSPPFLPRSDGDNSSDEDFTIVEEKTKLVRLSTRTGKGARKKRRVDTEDEDDVSLEAQELVKIKKKTTKKLSKNAGSLKKPSLKATASDHDVEDVPAHLPSYHSTASLIPQVDPLLEWFETVREKRQMPWRKRYNASSTAEEKGQRAYEIWVSEVMLQQTQVTTVIPYWNKWMEKWPTILDLAKADIEEVNSAWRGLGYYRRAKNLLLGAQRIANNKQYEGRLPDDPKVLEKDVEGVGRYTAGAICSMAYGVKTPIVDGNVHRLLCRLVALHAVPTSPALIKALWASATELVDSLPDLPEGTAGDLNQALMELGSQVCKPATPDCKACPVQAGCKAYKEYTSPTAASSFPNSEACTICAPLPISSSRSGKGPEVTVYPMKKIPKAHREERTGVMVLRWVGTEAAEGDEKWMLVKRPEKGLLAGLFEPPGIDLQDVEDDQIRGTVQEHAASHYNQNIDLAESDPVLRGEYLHVFSHIKMTYVVWEQTIRSSKTPTIVLPEGKSREEVVWLDIDQLRSANVGTGVKKVWELLKESRNPWAAEVKEKSKGKPKKKVEEKLGGKMQTKLSFGKAAAV